MQDAASFPSLKFAPILPPSLTLPRKEGGDTDRPPFSQPVVTRAIVEIKGLPVTRDFYGLLFRDNPGEWEETQEGLIFRTARESIEFVRRGRPRISGQTAGHHAYRVRRGRLPELAEKLVEAGHRVSWWHEDGPFERDVTAYLEDPSGNVVQLAPSGPVAELRSAGRTEASAPTSADDSAGLLDHVTLEFVDLEWAEDFYVKALGGELVGYSGWSTDSGPEVKAWLDGQDPSAPWTRYQRFSFRSRTMEAHATPQLFVRFGETMLCLFLARAHNQEPPEEIIRGTPRVVLRTDRPAAEVAAWLSGPAQEMIASRYRGRRMRFEQEGRHIYLRDPGGNFVELECS